jgi:valyl-tRNA synthetase
MVHPLIPFITEEIWQRVAPLAGRRAMTIMLQPYPSVDAALIDDKAADRGRVADGHRHGVRRIRSSMNIAPSKPLPMLLQHGSAISTGRVRNSYAAH